MTVPAVPAYSGTVPNKNTQTPRDFSNSADLFLPWLATTFPNAIAAFATQVNIVGAQCDADAVTAAASTAMLNAAIATVGATKWVSGTTYAIGDVRWSPIDFLAYRRKTPGVGTSDPSADAANWAVQSSALSIGETSGTAYRGDRGKTAYDHSQATGNAHGATTADIADSTNKRYCTDAQKTVIAATSGTNTGDGQAILVSGTNIKTINSVSILGSGNIGISSGFSHMVVLTSGTSWTCPAGISMIKIKTIDGGGGSGLGAGTGGYTTFTGGTIVGDTITVIGSTLGSTTGEAQVLSYGQTMDSIPNKATYGSGAGYQASGSGKGGDTTVKYLTVEPGTVYPITIGAGGIATAGGGARSGYAGAIIIEY